MVEGLAIREIRFLLVYMRYFHRLGSFGNRIFSADAKAYFCASEFISTRVRLYLRK